MHKYTDDTYLVLPTSNHQSGSKINKLDSWTTKYSLAINQRKSVEIVFVMPRSLRVVAIPPPAVLSITCIDSIKVLGC
jgi:hypothetical protein